MRTIKTSPKKLWISGQMNNPVGIEFSQEELQFYGVQGPLNDTDKNTQGNRPIFSPPLVIGGELRCCLDNEIDNHLFEKDHGISMFLSVRDKVIRLT